MALVEIDHDPPPKTLRTFGFAGAVVFGALGALCFWKGGLPFWKFPDSARTVAVVLWAVAGASLLASLVLPRLITDQVRRDGEQPRTLTRERLLPEGAQESFLRDLLGPIAIAEATGEIPHEGCVVGPEESFDVFVFHELTALCTAARERARCPPATLRLCSTRPPDIGLTTPPRAMRVPGR